MLSWKNHYLEPWGEFGLAEQKRQNLPRQWKLLGQYNLKQRIMIKQNDILQFAEVLDPNDDSCVMMAMEDEYVWDDLPNKVKVSELNIWLPLGSVRVLDAVSFKVVGHVRPEDTKESIVMRYLPENKWKFTREPYKANFE